MAEFGSKQHQEDLRFMLDGEPDPVRTMRVALKARRHNLPIKLTRRRYTPVGLDLSTVLLTRLVLADALGRLSGELHAVVVLLFDRGKTKEEAAEILSVSVRTLERRERDALRLMAEVALDGWAKPSPRTPEAR